MREGRRRREDGKKEKQENKSDSFTVHCIPTFRVQNDRHY